MCYAKSLIWLSEHIQLRRCVNTHTHTHTHTHTPRTKYAAASLAELSSYLTSKPTNSMFDQRVKLVLVLSKLWISILFLCIHILLRRSHGSSYYTVETKYRHRCHPSGLQCFILILPKIGSTYYSHRRLCHSTYFTPLDSPS